MGIRTLHIHQLNLFAEKKHKTSNKHLATPNHSGYFTKLHYDYFYNILNVQCLLVLLNYVLVFNF